VNVVRAIIFALVGSAAAAIAFGAELRYTGVVTGQVAEFSIPVAHEGPWRWARAKTGDNVLESCGISASRAAAGSTSSVLLVQVSRTRKEPGSRRVVEGGQRHCGR